MGKQRFPTTSFTRATDRRQRFLKTWSSCLADNKGGGMIRALRKTDGETVWKRSRPAKPNYPSPALIQAAGKTQLVFMGCDLVTSLDPLTGKQNWEIAGATTECVSTTVTDGTHIFTSGGYPTNHISAVKADGSGTVAWQNNSRVYVPSMLCYEGHLYAVLDAGGNLLRKCNW